MAASYKDLPTRKPKIGWLPLTIALWPPILLRYAPSSVSGCFGTAPTISSVIRLFKGSVTKQCGESIWQKGFYDHVVRNQEDLAEISEYIANNPIKWMEKHFTER